MLQKIQILGMSEHFVCIISDILNDLKYDGDLQIFPNLEAGNVSMPVTEFPYSVNPPGVSPKPDVPVIFGISRPKNKFPVFNYFRRGYGINKEMFQNIIHPSAYISKSSSLDYGIFLEQNVIISSQTRLAFGVTVKRGVLIGHHCVIGEYVDLNPGVVISGKVKIGRGVIIGSGATIIDGVTIGENSLIGAGSVVTRDIPAGVIAYGNPCKVVRENSEWKI